jgi:predicted Zn-dependent protease with MMP-like domain
LTPARPSSALRPATRVRRLVEAALDALPGQYAEHIANVEFLIRRHPFREQRRNLRGGSPYGLYEGIALPARAAGYDRAIPDRITIFWGPLVRDFPDDGTLADEVRKTVYHEIAHYFGLDEPDLDHTSVH